MSAADDPVQLQITAELLVGRSVAASAGNREVPEWPLHPGRLFMALVAALFETDAPESQRDALEWLAGLGPPSIDASAVSFRTPVQTFVPVNDQNRPQAATLQSAPGIPRGRQDRYFPTAVPADPTLVYRWAGVDPQAAAIHVPHLRELAAEVIRIGHSSSLVMLSVGLETGEQLSSGDRWQPVKEGGEESFRVASPGDLARLEAAYGESEVEAFAFHKLAVEESVGKAKAAAKKAFEQAVGVPYKANLVARTPAPARIGRSVGYRRVGDAGLLPVVTSAVYSPHLYVLSPFDGPRFGLPDTLAITRALRSAAMKACPSQPPPAWLSGHEADGSPTRDPHLAFLPLPFVGDRYGDGHLLGLAIAVPRALDPVEAGPLLAPLIADPDTGESRDIRLTLGRRGVWSLRLEDRSSPPLALMPDTWTRPCTTWGSTTPVVLDRFPKADRNKDRVGWVSEVEGILRESCARVGLPEPAIVDFGTTAWHAGAPRAAAKRRRTRSQSRQDAPLGAAFPSLPSKPGRPPRIQVHVFLHFSQPVEGPVLLGAGRFAGYGLFKPLPHHANVIASASTKESSL